MLNQVILQRTWTLESQFYYRKFIAGLFFYWTSVLCWRIRLIQFWNQSHSPWNVRVLASVWCRKQFSLTKDRIRTQKRKIWKDNTSEIWQNVYFQLEFRKLLSACKIFLLCKFCKQTKKPKNPGLFFFSLLTPLIFIFISVLHLKSRQAIACNRFFENSKTFQLYWNPHA